MELNGNPEVKEKMRKGESKEKFRVKNLTGGEVIFLKDGQVRFNLYPEDKESKET